MLHLSSPRCWVLVYNSHFNRIRVMLAYVASSPSGSNSTLVCGTEAPGDQQSDVWHAVAHGCFPAQHQPGISSRPTRPETLMPTQCYQDPTHPPSWCAVGLPSKTCVVQVMMVCVVGPILALIRGTWKWTQGTNFQMSQQDMTTPPATPPHTKTHTLTDLLLLLCIRPAPSFCLTSSTTPLALCEQHTC